MDRNEKRRFIEDLTANVAESLIKAIPQMPAEWDGLELRELIAEKFDGERHMSQRGRKAAFRTRLREYRNEVLVRNL